MKLPLRIAILECDTPYDGSFGDYFKTYSDLLKSAADTLGIQGLSSDSGLELSKWHVEVSDENPVAKYPSLQDVDAVLISGSRFNAYDSDQWILDLVSFTSEVLKQDRVRVLGVCFGHQIVGRALGSKVVRSDNWEICVCKVELSSFAKQLFRLGGLEIQQMHRDVLESMPSLPDAKYPLENLGWSDRCEIQGLYSKNRLMSVQGHPEFFEALVRKLIIARNEQGIIGDADFQDGLERVGLPHDGVQVGAAFLRFLLQD